MSKKSRIEKAVNYYNKYGDIPQDYNERLSYLYDKLNINEKKQNEILEKRNGMLNNLYYKDYNVVLYEEPEGSERPRARLVNRYNLADMAKNNSNFIHVYMPCAKEDNMYIKRLMEKEEFDELESLICTPCIVDITMYIETPKGFNAADTFLAEMGMIRPIKKPDWDNAGKKYTDMFNANVWLDDDLIVDGSVHKYYSILPRIEINIRYLNIFYNKFQYNQVSKRKNFPKESELTYYGRK